MKHIYCMALLCVASFANAQILKFGDELPDIEIGKVINFKDEKIRFKNYEGRLIILDYWSTTCIPCVGSMPKLDALQKKFGDKLLLLPITPQKEELIRSFWSKNKYTNTTSLPTIVNDSLRGKYFPEGGFPFYVWIKNNKIYNYTSAEEVNEKEISAVIGGKANPRSQQTYKSYDINNFLVSPNFIKQVNAKMYIRTLTTNIPDLDSQNSRTFYSNLTDSSRTFSRLAYWNQLIVGLYEYAFSLNNTCLGYPSRRILEVRDSSLYIIPKGIYVEDWNKTNTFCYECVLPATTTLEAMKHFMIEDLNNYFNLFTRIEKRRVPCFILTLKNGVNKIVDNISLEYEKMRSDINRYEWGSAESNQLLNDESKSKYSLSLARDVKTIVELVEAQNVHYKSGTAENPPIVDETGYKGKFRITPRIPKNGDFSELKKELNKFGFDLKKGERDLEMLIITEKDYRSFTK